MHAYRRVHGHAHGHAHGRVCAQCVGVGHTPLERSCRGHFLFFIFEYRHSLTPCRRPAVGDAVGNATKMKTKMLFEMPTILLVRRSHFESSYSFVSFTLSRVELRYSSVPFTLSRVELLVCLYTHAYKKHPHHAYAHVYTHSCTCVCTHVYTHSCTHVDTHAYTTSIHMSVNMPAHSLCTRLHA